MSAAFKNAKKKLVQSEFRRLLNEHKDKSLKDVKKIESPLAKYNELGQLSCILCKSIVKSAAVWVVHINSKQHRENVEIAKKLKERTNNFTVPAKRPLTPPLSEVPQKKLKGILKNSTNNSSQGTEDNKIPDDFFDTKSGATPILPVIKKQPQQEKTETENTDALPEGFFDDPKLDAKARNQEYKDPAEEEWERFQKEIREADNESAAIIAEDETEATNDRLIDEIDDQMARLSRVLDFVKKKEEVLSKSREQKTDSKKEETDEEDISDFDELEEFDWRSKKAFKK